jgi:predicted dehydrogenase
MSEELGVGIIGLGFMGRAHLQAYRAARRAGCPNRLRAVCDPDAERLTGRTADAGNMPLWQGKDALFDSGTTRTYEEPAELFAQEDLDLVSICSPTDTHVDLAIAALRSGRHVLVEKPLALRASEVERLLEVVGESDRLCMPAMCVRFWPGWRWLKECIESGELGPVRSAVFRRLSPRPDWSPGFYDDQARTGGALFDLHIHDSDFVQWCFGRPQSVITTGTRDHLSTAYLFAQGPEHVQAEGGWDHAPGFAFRMTYTVVFEKATADFDSSRDPHLLLSKDGATEVVDLPAGTGYEGEVRHLLTTIAGGGERLDATVEDALELTRLLEAEGRSLESGAPVSL